MSIRNGLNMKNELDAKNVEFDHSDAFLGKDLLTYPNRMNSSRGIMFGSHIEQFVVLAEPEVPRIFTNYENEVGKYSSSYKKSDRKWTVVEKISKFKDKPDYNYLLVVKDEDNNYDIIERKIGERLTEQYCYLNNNTVIDSKTKNSTIEPDEMLYHSTSFDEDGNYCYGVNAKAVYLIDNPTIEDAFVISESLAKKLDSHYIESVEININTNDILCNLYGDDKNYKSFPDVGESTDNEILTARRRVNYDTALYDLKSENLRRIINGTDSIFYADGEVIDINIYSNQDINELKINTFNDQLVHYIEAQEMYNMHIVNALKPIINDPNNTCSTNLTYAYRRAKDSLDKNTTWIDKSEFEGAIVVFTVLKRNHIHVGSKIVGRYGK